MVTFRRAARASPWSLPTRAFDPTAVAHALISRLRQERLRQGLSQLELANRSGVSRTMILRTEKFERAPTLETFLRLASGLKVDLAKELAAVQRKN